ncbi:TPA: hypothetical protein TVB62_002012 [Streptococcus equi subsp. zooepidemicus]|nr:hypothetical protein [Streptococcus equi subsp. zooepidemicus]
MTALEKIRAAIHQKEEELEELQEEAIDHHYRSKRQAIEKDITALRRQWREG